MPLNPDQLNIIALDEVRDMCRATRDEELGGMSIYANKDHRRTMEWALKGKKDFAEEVLNIIGTISTLPTNIRNKLLFFLYDSVGERSRQISL